MGALSARPSPLHEERPAARWKSGVEDAQRAVDEASGWVAPLQREMSRVIVGQKHLVERLIVGMLTRGHLLLEGMPGLAKTLAVKTLTDTVADAVFHRIQFTPDMLPADIVGTTIYNAEKGEFLPKRGPIFSNLILADEINRAPAKVQSALLEAMQERQVTLGGATHKLPELFLVLATQNPIEQEGTYPLPEAQLDRFLMKVNLGYPSRAEERAILDAMATSEPDLRVDPVVTISELAQARRAVNGVYVDDKIRDYVVDIIGAARRPGEHGLKLDKFIQYGPSPRATIGLTLAARAWAFMKGRGYVVPSDVKALAADVLRHRIGLTYEAEAEGIRADDLVSKILEALPNP
jgi:MoxR-like ATPase